MSLLHPFCLAFLVLHGAWAQVPASQPTVSNAPVLAPCDDCVPGVINFAKVDAALWRGSQPTAEGFRNLEKLGVRTIVSFRHDNDDLPLLKGTGLKYLRIPSRAFRPKDANIARFLKLMEEPAHWPVFIHCAQGRDRTGYNAAAYRMVYQGWKAEDAIAEMKTFRFNRVWVTNPGYMRELDVAEMRQGMAVTPAPQPMAVSTSSAARMP